MRKLVIQIPCFNEAETLPATLRALPRAVPGFTVVEWLVVDDGSVDGTADVAEQHGVDHVHRLPRHRGLAAAFVAGLDVALAAGADVIVNTDADNQYRAEDIPALVAPIVRGEADIVVGARPIGAIAHFSVFKKWLQRFGSWMVQRASGTTIPDAPSGFRAFRREAAQRLKVFNAYSHTLETVIQAGRKGMAITSVPVGVNPPARPSRLMRSTGGYIGRQALTIIRIFMTYRPFAFFAVPGAVIFASGFALGVRFLYHFANGNGNGHVQSLILAALLLGTGFFLGVVGLLADLAAVNRQLLEAVDTRLRHVEDRLRERPPA